MIIPVKCFQLDDSLASTNFNYTLFINKIIAEKHLIPPAGLLTINNKSKVIKQIEFGWKLALISMLAALRFYDDSLPLFL